MNVDHILRTLNDHQVRYLLIGGMNFLLRHQPVLTYDVDIWVEDTPENLGRCEEALAALDASWGPTAEDWRPVAQQAPGWLRTQSVYALTSPHGAVDVFRAVTGLEDWASSSLRAADEVTHGGVRYRGLSDADMLRCQEVLDVPDRKTERIRCLRQAVGEQADG